MRLTPAFLALLTASPSFAAERGYSVTGFDRVRVEGPFAVSITSGKAPSARAIGGADALERVSVSVEGRTLRVRPSASGWGGYPGRPSAPARIELTSPDISTASLLGPGSLRIDRMRGAKAVLTVEGSGRIAVGALDVDNASLAVAGSGTIEAAGRAKQTSAIARGSAEIRAEGLTTADLSMVSETSGRVALTATRSAKVTSSGAGPVEIDGTAACQVRHLGAGPLRCGK